MIGTMSPTCSRLLPELPALAALCGDLGCQAAGNAEMDRRRARRNGCGKLGVGGKLGPTQDHGRDFGIDLIELVASDSGVGRHRGERGQPGCRAEGVGRKPVIIPSLIGIEGQVVGRRASLAR